MAKFVVMLRVKDGMLFAEEWLQCFEKLADEIVVLDNGSTDGTYELLKAHPKVVDIVRTEGYNEGRDKNLLYTHVRSRKPDWVLWVDIDEIFEPQLTRRHFDRLMSRRMVNKYAFRRFHFIDKESFAGSWFRLNYSAGHDRIMWREAPTGYFENFIMDSPNVKGIKGLKLNTNFRLKHLGYIDKDLVDRKKQLYLGMIADEKKSSLDEMYLTRERRIKWIDDRKNVRVILLNYFLTCIQVKHLAEKAVRKAKGLLQHYTGRLRAQNTSAINS